MVGRLYECSGLRVLSEIPLPAQSAEGHSDLRVTMGAPITEQVIPPDQIIAALEIDGQLRYAIVEEAGGYVCQFPTIVDVHVNADLTELHCRPLQGAPVDFIPILIVGTVVAFVLSMRGRCVLHASAVEVEEGAIAFVGTSGQGKSTMAALFSSTGARLIADDVLSLEIATTGETRIIWCDRSGPEIRLRPKAASLIERFDRDTPVRVTIDDRQAIMPPAVSTERVTLAGIILPRPDRQHPDVSARRLHAAEAALWLTRCQRIEGWARPDHLRRQFESIGQVVATVPVLEVRVPWGPPFAEELVEQILRSCGFNARVSG